jgi:hypothetical protein
MGSGIGFDIGFGRTVYWLSEVGFFFISFSSRLFALTASLLFG